MIEKYLPFQGQTFQKILTDLRDNNSIRLSPKTSLITNKPTENP